MASRPAAELTGWLGGTVIVGLVFGIGSALFVRPGSELSPAPPPLPPGSC